MATLSQATQDAIAAAVASALATALPAAIAAAAPAVSQPADPAVASAHWKARDIACNAAKPCKDTFRTVKGRDWHVANIKH